MRSAPAGGNRRERFIDRGRQGDGSSVYKASAVAQIYPNVWISALFALDRKHMYTYCTL